MWDPVALYSAGGRSEAFIISGTQAGTRRTDDDDLPEIRTHTRAHKHTRVRSAKTDRLHTHTRERPHVYNGNNIHVRYEKRIKSPIDTRGGGETLARPGVAAEPGRRAKIRGRVRYFRYFFTVSRFESSRRRLPPSRTIISKNS